MKLADVKVGGRYVATLPTGETMIVVVERKQIPPASWNREGAWQTLILVREVRSGAKHTLRSARRLRGVEEGRP